VFSQIKIHSTITVPRETWGALREELEKSRSARTYSERIEAHECAVLALTAANAVSAPKGLFVDLIASHGPEFVAEMADLSLTNEGDMLAKQPEILAEYTGINGARQWASVGAWLYEGDAIAVISDHFRGVRKMMQPLGWYCVSRDGLATQCADQRDAEMTAKSANRDWPNSAPYRAVQLCEFEAHPQATEPAPSAAEKLTDKIISLPVPASASDLKSDIAELIQSHKYKGLRSIEVLGVFQFIGAEIISGSNS
jgi:hypothetical protein